MERRKSTALAILAAALLAFAAVSKWHGAADHGKAVEGHALTGLADGDRVFVRYDAAADKLEVVRFDGVNLGLVPTTTVTAETLARFKADPGPHLIVNRNLPPPKP